MKSLKHLLCSVEYRSSSENIESISISDIAYNSANAGRGVLFVCIKGSVSDGHDFASAAYAAGSRAFICERTLDLPPDAVQIEVSDTRAALAVISSEFFSHPEKKLTLIGVTGTKGKSTVCEMIRHILCCSGKKAASIGTVGIRIGEKMESTQNSTPESYILYRSLSQMVESDVEYAVIEISSQAIMQKRVCGMQFDAAVYTNLSRDHIGGFEHPDFEHYKECKKELFKNCKAAFINVNDSFGIEFAKASLCPVYTYGDFAKTTAQGIRYTKVGGKFGTEFVCICGEEKQRVYIPMPGKFSCENALAAISVCAYFGIPLSISAEALKSFHIKGRFETVEIPRRDISCVIDYAHNERSMEYALSSLSEYPHNRIICVFGSVGDRTRERRRGMAILASRFSDLCIITSDNPGGEDPNYIIEEISGYIPSDKRVCISDRKKAIEYALDIAESGDILLFAGKGHEEYQLIKGKKLPFSEEAIIKEYFKEADKLCLK